MELAVAVFMSSVIFAFFGMFTLPFAIIMGTNDGERRERARMRTEGVRAEAWVRGFRRISMTQHRVLIEARLPSGPVGRELVVVGLSDDWLAHHAALGQPIAVFADRTGSKIVIDQPEDGPVPSVGHTVKRIVAMLGGVAAVSLVIGAGLAFFTDRMDRRRDESAAAAEVIRLRDTFDKKGLEVDRIRVRRSRATGVRQDVTLEFESGTSCIVTVRTADASGRTAPSGALQNGHLSLVCTGSRRDVPKIEAAFRAFRP